MPSSEPTAPDPTTLRERPSARILPVDEAGCVLLFHFQDADPSRRHWATVGGGVEPGESFDAAAVRELFEETGLRVESCGPCVAERRCPIRHLGEWVLAVERYYVVRCARFEPSRDGFTPHEHNVTLAHRWWTPDELRATREAVYPPGLAELIAIS